MTGSKRQEVFSKEHLRPYQMLKKCSWLLQKMNVESGYSGKRPKLLAQARTVIQFCC